MNPPDARERVFVSWAGDDAGLGRQLVDGLREGGIDVVGAGDTVAEEGGVDAIEAALISASALVVLLSPSSIDSPNLLFELGVAVGGGKKVVLVLLSTTVMETTAASLVARYPTVVAEGASTHEVVERVLSALNKRSSSRLPSEGGLPPPQENDRDLLTRVARGDSDAFETLVRRHALPIRRFLQMTLPGADVEDVEQDVWMRAWRSAVQGTIDPERSFKVWLFQVAKSRAFDQLTRISADRAFSRERRAEPTDDPTSRIPDEIMLRDALKHLRGDEQAMAALILSGFRRSEAAEALGLSRHAAEKSFRSAMRTIRRSLAGSGEGANAGLDVLEALGESADRR